MTFEIAVNEFSSELKMQVLCQTNLFMTRMATRALKNQPCPQLGIKVIDKILERNNPEIKEGSEGQNDLCGDVRNYGVSVMCRNNGITSSENGEILRRRSLYMIR